MERQYFNQRMLEINVLSAEDLSIKGRPIKKKAIVCIRTDTREEAAFTTVNKDGGSYPLWNEKIDVKFPSDAKEIIVQVCCGKNLIGQSIIPTRDIMDDYIPANYLHLLSYRLRDHKEYPNGIINLSIRVKDYGFT